MLHNVSLRNIGKAVTHATDQVKTEVNKVANQAKTDIDKAAKDVRAVGTLLGKVIAKVGNDFADVGLAPLIPFKGAMKAAIKTAAYPNPNPPDDTLHLAQEFVKKVIQKENFESLENFARARGS